MVTTEESARLHVHPVERLYEDHALILEKLSSAETRIAAEKTGDRAYDAKYWTRLASFLHVFADVEHHAKEEQILFTAMQKEGVVVKGGPIGFMLDEHQESRALIHRIEEAARGSLEEETRNAVLAFAELSRQHIWKENEILFKLAVKVLPEEVCEEIFRQFERLDAEHRRIHTESWMQDLLRSI